MSVSQSVTANCVVTFMFNDILKVWLHRLIKAKNNQGRTGNVAFPRFWGGGWFGWWNCRCYR